MKSLFLIRNVDPKNYGGAESYQIELAKILQKNNFEPIIFSASKKLLRLAQENHIKTVESPYIKNQNWSGWKNILLPIYVIHQVKLYFWYKKQIKTYHPVALDIQSRDEWIAATIAGKRTNTKVLWTDHIDFRTWVLQNVKKKYKNLIGKYILKLAKIPYRIIAISDFEKKWFEKNIGKLSNITVIKNGIIDQADEYKNTKAKENNFCYIGRLIDYKGIKELIKAFDSISSEFPYAVLNIYGEGPDSESYRHLAKDNRNIIFHGFSNDPIRSIASNDTFILPSYYEGLSIALLQAAMLGKTIIATNVDGNPEVVIDKKTGITVEPRSSIAIADAMKQILNDPNFKKQLAKNARRHYEENFNFEKTVKNQFIELLN